MENLYTEKQPKLGWCRYLTLRLVSYSEAGYRRQEAYEKKITLEQKMGNFSFFSEDDRPAGRAAGQCDQIHRLPLGSLDH